MYCDVSIGSTCSYRYYESTCTRGLEPHLEQTRTCTQSAKELSVVFQIRIGRSRQSATEQDGKIRSKVEFSYFGQIPLRLPVCTRNRNAASQKRNNGCWIAHWCCEEWGYHRGIHSDSTCSWQNSTLHSLSSWLASENPHDLRHHHYLHCFRLAFPPIFNLDWSGGSALQKTTDKGVWRKQWDCPGKSHWTIQAANQVFWLNKMHSVAHHTRVQYRPFDLQKRDSVDTEAIRQMYSEHYSRSARCQWQTQVGYYDVHYWKLCSIPISLETSCRGSLVVGNVSSLFYPLPQSLACEPVFVEYSCKMLRAGNLVFCDIPTFPMVEPSYQTREVYLWRSRADWRGRNRNFSSSR